VGDQVDVLKELMSRYGVTEVHISEEFEPYGRARDTRIEKAGIKLIRTGSPYAVAPGRVRKPSDDTPYKVYTPFYRAWLVQGWRAPAKISKEIKCAKPGKSDRNFPDWKAPEGFIVPPAGEAAALLRWKEFKKKSLDLYDEQRNFAGIDGTSKLSHHLKFGEIHPRTLLADLNKTKAHEVYRKEIAWREFYADVLFHNPHTDNDYYLPKFAGMQYDKLGVKVKQDTPL